MTTSGRTLEVFSCLSVVLALGASLLVMSMGLAWSAAAAKLFGSVSIATWLLAARKTRVLLLPSIGLTITATSFVFLVTLSSLVSPQSTSWRVGLQLTIPAMQFFVAAGLLIKVRLRCLVWRWLTVITAILVSYGLLQAVGLDLTPRLSGGQAIWISSAFYHYSHYASYLALLAPAALAIALFSPGGSVRTIAWTMSALLGLSLYLTWSWDSIVIASAIGSALGLFWVWRGSGDEKGFRLRLAIIGFASVMVCSIVLFSWGKADQPQYIDGFADLVYQLENRLSARGDLYKMALKLPADRPLFGSGPGTFEAAFTAVKTKDSKLRPIFRETVNYAHNDLLQVASEVGIPASLAYMMFWLLAIFTPAPRLRFVERLALRSILVSVLLCGLLDATVTVFPPIALLAFIAAGMLHAPTQGSSLSGLGSSPPLSSSG